jgi:hypothetical protein
MFWRICLIGSALVLKCVFPRVRGQFALGCVTALFVLSALWSLPLVWAYQRATWGLVENDFGRDWPYPDRVMIRIERCDDARHPVPRGFIKIHGEWPRVQFLLGAGISVSLVVVGSFLGVVLRSRYI